VLMSIITSSELLSPTCMAMVRSFPIGSAAAR
jgi:hypothetical protein